MSLCFPLQGFKKFIAGDKVIYIYMCLVRVILSFPTRRHYKTYLNVTQTGCLVKAKQDPDDQI